MRPDDLPLDAGRLRDLVSLRTGLIREVFPIPRGADEPVPPFLYAAALASLDETDASSRIRHGAGRGLTPQEAVLGAIGEAIERYCAAQVPPRGLVRATLREVEACAVSPRDLVLYSDQQHARGGVLGMRWSPELTTSWVEGRGLPDGRPRFLPAALTYLPVRAPHFTDILAPPTSNGLAAGVTLEAAVLGGLLELIERDAFLVHWLNELSAPEIVLVEADGIAADIEAHYARFGTRVRAFDLTTDLSAYVFLGLALDETGTRPAAIIGLGCDLDPNVALRSAMLELCQGRPGEVRHFLRRRERVRLRPEDVSDIHDHGALFHSRASLPELAFLWRDRKVRKLSSLPSRSTGSVEGDLAACVDAIRRAGGAVAFADLTTPDVKPYGLHAVRVLATKLQPLHFGFGQERLGGDRLLQLPVKLGRRRAPLTETELNDFPHPLA